MLNKYRSLLFLFVAIDFMSSLQINGESENSVYHFPPNQNEVEECEKDFSKCQYFSTYPSSHVEKLIKENIIKKEWFGEDEGKLIRQSDSANGFESLCEVEVEITYPKGIMTENKEFIYIVQMQVNDNHYYQPVRTEKCDDNQTCSVYNGQNFIELNSNDGSTKFNCFPEKCMAKLIGITVNGTVVREVPHSKNCFCVCKYCKTGNNTNKCN